MRPAIEFKINVPNMHMTAMKNKTFAISIRPKILSMAVFVPSRSVIWLEMSPFIPATVSCMPDMFPSTAENPLIACRSFVAESCMDEAASFNPPIMLELSIGIEDAA